MATTRKPRPPVKATPIEDVIPEVGALENEGAPVYSSEDELVLRQEEAEATPDFFQAPVVPTTYEVRFTAAHTFGSRVYVEGETAFVPIDDPFYGLSPKEQEETRGMIHFVPVTD